MRRDQIWSKFTETSQHMELALAEFEDEYPWTTSRHINTSQPDITTQASDEPTAGLRDLYCFQFDYLLTNIQALANNWLIATTANYKSAFEGQPNGKKSLDDVLYSGRLISASILKFPKAGFAHRNPNPSQPDIWAQSNFKHLQDSGRGASRPFQEVYHKSGVKCYHENDRAIYHH